MTALIENDDPKAELLAVRYPVIRVLSRIPSEHKRWLADVDVTPGELELRIGATVVDLALVYLREQGACSYHEEFNPNGVYYAADDDVLHYYVLKDFTLKEKKAVFDAMAKPL